MKTEKSTGKFVGLFFCMVGGFMIGLAFVISSFMGNFAKGAEEVVARISDIDTYREHDGDVRHNVTVLYYKDGELHEQPLNDYNSSMRVGHDIKIYLKGNSAMSVSSVESKLGAWIVAGMGVIFFIIGFSLATSSVRKKKRWKRLMETGELVYAEVTGGIYCRNVTINNRHPYKLDCKYEDVFSGNTYMFRSDYMWTDPELYVGSQVKVYMNRENMREYYVDTDSLEQMTGAAEEIVYDYR